MAIVLSPMALFCGYVFVEKGFRSDLLFAAVLPYFLYAVILILVCSNRVSVAGDGVAVVSWFFWKQFVPFADIDHSDVQVLAERDHPVFIVLHYRFCEEMRACAIGLKSYRKDDVEWLCALPELKAEWYPGFTKKT